ncbi:uncharacterized protein G2W53_012583 [Senna tora]|uniref:Uncharacterized protein n=1 Tax=Senna tora TaxID=362788 RepID=A0A834TX68_9FABA|nr:uncharacterized protein G2W53_012583 [Senna tora]
MDRQIFVRIHGDLGTPAHTGASIIDPHNSYVGFSGHIFRSPPLSII